MASVPNIVCFGEVLWDLLPTGKCLGGAPLNVAYHLGKLGCRVKLASCVGRDSLGVEARRLISRAGIEDGLLLTHPHLPTGTVSVSLDPGGQPSYLIESKVAWDEILARPAHAEERPAALVFGSLALRTAWNRERLLEWRSTRPGLTICDLNLRAPHDELQELMPCLEGVDVLKLNVDEAVRLVGSRASHDNLEAMALALASRFKCDKVCITLGKDGATLWEGGELVHAPSPNIVVKDTIGAGDAFCAALVEGLLHTSSQSRSAVLSRACRLGAFVASQRGAQPVYDSFSVWSEA